MAVAESVRNVEFQRIAIVGNQHLSQTIINAFSHTVGYKVVVITPISQEPYLQRNLQSNAVAHRATDFSRQSLESAFADIDLVISTTSPGDVLLQKKIVDACVSARVTRFIPNEFGLDSQSAMVRERLPSYKVRHDVLKYLETLRGQIEWVGLAVGTILDHELLNGKLGFDLKWQSASIPGDRDTTFPVTSLARVGELVLALVQHWSSFQGSYLYANGCMTSAGAIGRALEQEIGAEWVIDYTDGLSMLNTAERMLNGGWPDAGWTLLERVIAFDSRLGAATSFCQGADGLQQLLPDECVEDIVRRAVHTWRHTTQGDCGCN